MKPSDLPEVLDLGEGRTLRFFVNDTGDVVGAFETHPSLIDTREVPGADGHDVGEPCTGALHFAVPESWVTDRPKWQVESWSPLTLLPSVLCTLCQNHGFIREGKWQAA